MRILSYAYLPQGCVVLTPFFVSLIVIDSKPVAGSLLLYHSSSSHSLCLFFFVSFSTFVLMLYGLFHSLSITLLLVSPCGFILSITLFSYVSYVSRLYGPQPRQTLKPCASIQQFRPFVSLGLFSHTNKVEVVFPSQFLRWYSALLLTCFDRRFRTIQKWKIIVTTIFKKKGHSSVLEFCA